ncbi:hypothetical protein BB560_001048 [Smittium megazygosporum]|uniref:COG complex component COG2 C-terminal domain-containing protein n=1 Tax=Smittium megazygosporum TaxID=133381 RepID=A0A2T9ZIQ8_9FUNG|nr:hypothetical protein BB560_001048 [Smittium megazygosporum]
MISERSLTTQMTSKTISLNAYGPTSCLKTMKFLKVLQSSGFKTKGISVDPEVFSKMLDMILEEMMVYFRPIQLYINIHLSTTPIDLSVNSFWPEFSNQTQYLLPTLFVPGIPSNFSANYLLAEKFTQKYIKNICISQASAERLCNSQGFELWWKKWHLPAYFAIQQKKIIEKLLKELNYFDNLPLTRYAIYKSFSEIWNHETFIYPLFHRWWKLSLQIVTNYSKFVDQKIEKLNTDLAESKKTQKTAYFNSFSGTVSQGGALKIFENLSPALALAHDIAEVSACFKALTLDRVIPILESNSGKMESEGELKIENGNITLNNNSDIKNMDLNHKKPLENESNQFDSRGLSSSSSDILIQNSFNDPVPKFTEALDCVESFLEQGISSLFTLISNFILDSNGSKNSSRLSNGYFIGLPSNLVQSLVKNATENICDEILTVITDVLENIEKASASLQRFRQSGLGMGSKAKLNENVLGMDDIKIRRQLYHDVRRLQQILVTGWISDLVIGNEKVEFSLQSANTESNNDTYRDLSTLQITDPMETETVEKQINQISNHSDKQVSFAVEKESVNSDSSRKLLSPNTLEPQSKLVLRISPSIDLIGSFQKLSELVSGFGG